MFFLSKYFKNKKEKKAFFLIEVLLAVFLVLVGFLTIISLASSGLKESMDSRDQIIAGLLAQEGAEVVRNIRDNNWANGRISFKNLPDNKDNCPIDMNDDNSIDGSDCKNNSDLGSDDFILEYSGGYYVKNTAATTDTKFRRKVDFNKVGSGIDQKLIVTSMVAWGGSFKSVSNCSTVNKCVYVQTILTKWGEPIT